jgi:hypothetical protein
MSTEDYMTSILNGSLSNILNLLSAAAGLGTAAMGLVDASKAFDGGPSNFGFKCVKDVVTNLVPNQANQVPNPSNQQVVVDALKANWLNGMKIADQKAFAKSLVEGTRKSPNDKLSGMEAARLEAAYERGDQLYRNMAKLLAMATSAILGVIGGWVIWVSGGGPILKYFAHWEFVVALIIGLAATPLAPVAKDLASTLEAVVKKVNAGKP